MTPTDPDNGRKDEGRAPTPPPVPSQWTKPDPVFERAAREQEKRQSPLGIFFKVIGFLIIGVVVLFGLLLGTCFLIAVVKR